MPKETKIVTLDNVAGGGAETPARRRKSPRRKFRPGPPFSSVWPLLEHMEAGGWVYWYGRPKSPRFMENCAYSVLRSGARRGMFRPALPNDAAPTPIH